MSSPFAADEDMVFEKVRMLSHDHPNRSVDGIDHRKRDTRNSVNVRTLFSICLLVKLIFKSSSVLISLIL